MKKSNAIFIISVIVALVAFICICTSYEVLGSVLAIIALTSIWADDIIADRRHQKQLHSQRKEGRS